jgi:hypothetical protein
MSRAVESCSHVNAAEETLSQRGDTIIADHSGMDTPRKGIHPIGQPSGQLKLLCTRARLLHARPALALVVAMFSIAQSYARSNHFVNKICNFSTAQTPLISRYLRAAHALINPLSPHFCQHFSHICTYFSISFGAQLSNTCNEKKIGGANSGLPTRACTASSRARNGNGQIPPNYVVECLSQSSQAA